MLSLKAYFVLPLQVDKQKQQKEVVGSPEELTSLVNNNDDNDKDKTTDGLA